MREQSEYGSGLVVNLAKFSEHLSNKFIQDCYHVDWWMKNQTVDLTKQDINLRRSIEMFQAVYLKVHGNAKSGLSSMIELWANGATDHFYDMQVPKKWTNTPLAKKVAELRKFGLQLGHGFSGELHTIDDVTKMRKLVEEICLEIDKHIGIKNGNWGQY